MGDASDTRLRMKILAAFASFGILGELVEFLERHYWFTLGWRVSHISKENITNAAVWPGLSYGLIIFSAWLWEPPMEGTAHRVFTLQLVLSTAAFTVDALVANHMMIRDTLYFNLVILTIILLLAILKARSSL